MSLIPTHFYSDPHFGHAAIIEYADRPFYSVKIMDEVMVKNYNSVVGENDTCLWLGDCFLGPVDYADRIMSRLNGTKILVCGNHDRSPSRMASMGFSLVCPSEVVLFISGRQVRASHRPYGDHKDCPTRNKGEILLHGHTHSKTPVSGNQINVGVDAWNFAPVSYFAVRALISSIAE